MKRIGDHSGVANEDNNGIRKDPQSQHNVRLVRAFEDPNIMTLKQ